MKPPIVRRRPWRIALTAGAIAGLVVGVTACTSSKSKSPDSTASGTGGSSSSSQASDPNAELTVWTDATRQPAFTAYQKANPNVKMKVSVVDATALLSKIQLANRVNSGWPDVIFDSTPSDVASLASPLFNYAQPLDTLVPSDVQQNFATHNAACTINGKLYCLQNDLAQSVLWYNKPLMAQFGYQVPKTWDEYQALGKKVAQEHPGYLLGAFGDVNLYYDLLWSSGCPLATATSSTEVTINTKDTKCTRVADTFDPLFANGSVSRLSPFDPATITAAKANKFLMMPGPSWFAQFVMQATSSWSLPNGQIAAAAFPTWSGETTNYSGAWGGGIYVVSSHSKNKTGAAAMVQWLTTNTGYQSTAPTYPAYVPAATAWIGGLKTNSFFAEDPSSVLTDAAQKINPAEAPTRYQVTPAVTSTVVAAVKAGKTIASALGDLQTQLSGLAQTAGYSVSP